MENIGEQKESIGETLPIIIEKKPRKKRETQSPAQLETLKRGRERLAEKRKQQRESKKQEPMNDALTKLDMKYNEIIEKLESRIKESPPPPQQPQPPKRTKFFV